jgi:putative transposase
MLSSNKRRSSDEWRGIFTRQASSGLSVQAFCARESINASSFYRWRGLSVDTQVTGECGVTGAEVVQAPPLRARAEFVDLGQLRASSSRVELRLDFGEGLLLTLVRG